AARFLDGDDVGNLGKAENGFGEKVCRGAARDVVQEEGQGHGFGDGAEVLVLAFLVGPVVVGVGGEDAGEVGDFGDALGIVHRLRCRVVGAAGEDGRAAGGDFDGDFDDAVGLGFGERGG